MRYLKSTLLAIGIVFLPMKVYAFHNLRKGISDMLGPAGWGFYLLLPIPFLVVGVLAFLLYRTSHSKRSQP